jgi:hypothetical protein
MMKDQPPFRLKKIQQMLDTERTSGSADRRISLLQALSLRRTHLKLLNPRCSMSSLRLGKVEDIRHAAALFEACVDAYLRKCGLAFWTEEEQREQYERRATGVPFNQRKQPPTPDFMLRQGQSAALAFVDGTARTEDGAPPPAPLHWIEAKMFYGASTIPSGTPNAVGCILPKVAEYVRLYGPGGIVFMYGCGARLAAQLLEAGVVALDARGLDLHRVEQHQQRWCSDSWSTILF